MRFVKPIVILILVCAFLLLVVYAKRALPRIVVDPPSQDLGVIPQRNIELTYTVRNDGAADLQIERISTSCDCTKAVIDRDNIAPGQSGVLTVTLDPAEDNLYGNITRVIYLRSNDPEKPEVSVEFHAVIEKP